MDRLNRRVFIGTALGAAGVFGTGILVGTNRGEAGLEPLALVRDERITSPTDRVTLGKSGVSVSVVGIGTGTIGWNHRSNQTRLGQKEFTRLIRHALDRGITFFDLADQYGSHPYFATAIEGVPRDRYTIQTKSNSRTADGARKDIDRFLDELGTDYVDSLIVHNVTSPNWTTQFRGVMDVFEEAREAGKVRAHGVTCHSFGALQAAEASDWVQINQVRWNPGGAHMDADVRTAHALFAKMRRKGQGMIGMKVVGQGEIVGSGRRFTPAECFRFQVETGVVDAFVVGVESVDEIDQLIDGTGLALSEVGYRALASA